MAGKESERRPTKVSNEIFKNNWNKIFDKNESETTKPVLDYKELLYDLLACIHGDGGYRTSHVGVVKSVEDARNAWYERGPKEL